MVSNTPAAPQVAAVTAERIVQETKDIPSAPRVLPRLKDLLGDGNSSVSDVVAMIRIEPSIAARVLQVSNSAYYSKGSARCTSVGEGIGRVGFDQVYAMVMHAVTSQVLLRPLVTYQLEPDDLWRRSVTCGMAAELLADQCGQDRETAYTLGLLHGIGMIAVDSWALINNPSLVMTPKAFPKEYTQSERALMGFTHADVGGILLKRWDFPADVVSAIRYQYSPPAAGTGASLATVIYAAKWLCDATWPTEGTVVPPPDELWLKRIKLDLKRLGKVSEDLKSREMELNQLLQIEG
ncbi:MAG: HDOD domain-containing protein [Opitutaceae bacterium]|nr:HDOD domain-containing protein [Opitutaceae bacterium]